MNNYYEQLMNFKGADQLKEIIKKWDILSQNISMRSFDAPIFLPDLLIYTHQGFGNTRLISLLAEYLSSKQNLMKFYGDVKFFEYDLEYCSPDQQFHGMYRLIDCAREAAGFRNEFKGIIRINIDGWVGHHKEKHFIDLLNFLQTNTPYWLIILTLTNPHDDEKTKEMESVIRMYLRIEKVALQMPTDIELAEYADEYLGKYGLSLNEEAKQLLSESIKILKKNRYFYGFKTIIDLCNDIVCDLYSKPDVVSPVITAEMLVDFSADSEYIKSVIIKSKKTTLGF